MNNTTMRRNARTREVRARMAELAGDHDVAKRELNIAQDLRAKMDWTSQLDTYMWDMEVGELVECEICHREIPSTDAYAVLESTFVCNPKIDERCLGTWNNDNHVRGD